MSEGRPTDPPASTSNGATPSDDGPGNVVHGDVSVSGGDFVRGDKIVTHVAAETAYDVSGLPNPYLGLRPFGYTDRDIYAGRERDVQDTVARLMDPSEPLKLMFITGPSGCGKSSFVQAGLLPALEVEYARRHRKLRYVTMRPTRNPIAMFHDALAQLDPPARSPEELETGDYVTIIVVDQFEEVFSRADAPRRDAFLTLLRSIAATEPTPAASEPPEPPAPTAPTSPVETPSDVLAREPAPATSNLHVLCVLRSDYLDELFNVKGLWDDAKRGVELRALNEDELREAILRPLQIRFPNGEKRMEPSLVEWLANDAAGDATYLPLLQVTLQEIWKKGSLRLAAYTNLTEAIKARAETVYKFEDHEKSRPTAERSAAQKQIVLGIFLDLVEVSPDDDERRDVRQRRAKDELTKGSDERAALIEDLIAARLLSASTELRDGAHVDYVDIIHETLIRNWDRLQAAITDNRAQLRSRERFRRQFHEWHDNARADKFLLDGVRLEEARELQKRGDIVARDPAAAEFIQRSLSRRRRTVTRIIGGLIALSLALLALAAVAFAASINAAQNAANAQAAEATSSAAKQEVADQLVDMLKAQQAEAAKERATRATSLAASATAQRDADPALAMRLAVEAVRLEDIADAQTTLRALLASRLRRALPHDGYVNSATFSPDGARMVTAGGYEARVWDTTSGKLLATLPHSRTAEHDDPTVFGARFSPDGKLVVTAGRDRVARIWDAASGALLRTLEGHTDDVNAAEFSPDGKLIVTASGGLNLGEQRADDSARIWDAATGQQLSALRGHRLAVNAAHFSPSGKFVVTASDDGEANVWDAQTGKLLRLLRGHRAAVRAAAFSPDDRLVITASDDDTARIWDAQTGRMLKLLRGHTDSVTDATFSPDGRWALTASEDKTARIWSALNDSLDGVVLAAEAGLRGATFSPDGQFAVGAGEGGEVTLWSVADQRATPLRSHEGPVVGAQFSPDGKLIVSASEDKTARMWSAKADEPIELARASGANISQLALSANGRVLVAAGNDGSIQAWELPAALGGVRATAPLSAMWSAKHEQPALELAVSSKGDVFATTHRDGVARVWTRDKRAPAQSLKGHEGVVTSVDISPDDTLLATGGEDKTVRVWRLADGALLSTLSGHLERVNDVRFSPDGSQLVSASDDRTAREWDVSSGKELRKIELRTPLRQAMYSPDGTLIATVSNGSSASTSFDARVSLWDAGTGGLVRALSGAHTAAIVGAAFSPDGARMVTTSEDKTARLWNTASGAVTGMLERGASPPRDGVGRGTATPSEARFTSDGEWVLVGGSDGLVLAHVVGTPELLALAEPWARELSCDETQKFLKETKPCP